jgi:GTP-binding protein EngB required for normal cell division
MRPFQEVLRQFGESLDGARNHLDTLRLAEAISSLAKEANESEFRIAVLGRFKCGKSSALNALIGEEVLPTDVLPCTSGVVEIRRGKRKSFAVQDGAGSKKCSFGDFTAGAGAAHSSKAAPKRWLVELPIEWLPHGLTLVDTPGTDEDAERNKTAHEEFARTDAAVVLLNASQPVRLDDIDLVNDLQKRVNRVVVVVNRADAIAEAERGRVLEHAQRKLSEIGVPGHRVLLLSASEALAGAPWAAAMLDQVRNQLSSVLLGSTAGARLASLCSKTQRALEEISPRAKAAVKAAATEAQRARAEVDAAEEALGAFQADSRRFEAILEAHKESAEREASRVMRREWCSLVSSLKAHEDAWRSECDPLFSAKAFASEIGECAKRDLQAAVEQFVKEEIQPLVADEVEAARKEIHRAIERIVASAADAGMGSADDLFERLDRGILKDAFGKAVEGSADTSTEAVVTTVVSAIVGYVIADVILFYILGVIAGFLNPILLGAAALGGIGAYVFKGRDWVQSYVRGKIADKLISELCEGPVTSKVEEGVVSAVREVFGKLAKGYRRQIERLIDDAQARCAERSEKASKAARAAGNAHEAAERAFEALGELVEILGKESEELRALAGNGADPS